MYPQVTVLRSVRSSAFRASMSRWSIKNYYIISIVFDTVYGVKGETHDATLYLETETKKSSDIRRILPLLERKITQCKNELQEKSRRCIYVGFSRPKYLLCLAISEKTYVGHETAFSSWKIVDLRSEDAM